MQAEQVNKRLVKFVAAALMFFAWGVIQGAIQAQKPVHDFISMGPGQIIIGAHVHVLLLGWVSMMGAASVYYLVPVLTGKPIAGPRLIDWIFWIWAIVTAIMGILMIWVGIVAGNALIGGIRGPQLDAVMAPFMMIIGMLSIIAAIILTIFVIQILASICRKKS